LCDFRYRGSYCAHGKVKGVRCMGDERCPVLVREAPMFFEKDGWFRSHDDRFTGVWRK